MSECAVRFSRVRIVSGAAIVSLVLTFSAAQGVPAEFTKAEKAAIHSMTEISQAQLVYSATYPDHGFACSLGALGGDPKTGQATAEAAQFLPADLASGHKDGYVFKISQCQQLVVKGKPMILSYKLFAAPDHPGEAARKSFCEDENLKLMFDPNGGTDCAQEVR